MLLMQAPETVKGPANTVNRQHSRQGFYTKVSITFKGTTAMVAANNNAEFKHRHKSFFKPGLVSAHQ
jgi:hypothetical protein